MYCAFRKPNFDALLREIKNISCEDEFTLMTLNRIWGLHREGVTHLSLGGHGSSWP